MDPVKFKYISRVKYNSLPVKDENTLYFIANEHVFYKGAVSYGQSSKSIVSVTKTSTSGLVDTYTILYTDGSSSSFDVTNGAQGVPGNDGASVGNISWTSNSGGQSQGTAGTIDTYTVYDNNANPQILGTFLVTNGSNGQNGQDGQDGETPTISITNITGGHNVAFIYGSGDPRNKNFDILDGAQGADGTTPNIGTNGNWFIGSILVYMHKDLVVTMELMVQMVVMELVLQ